jgi:predicted Zn finger-like uncharacterized protein
MSFITRCPSCSTSFKVVADQLRISQGWVRCGHCADIFDANQDLKPWIPTPPVLTTVVDDQQQPSGDAWARQARESHETHDSPMDGVLDGLAELNEMAIQTETNTPARDEPVWTGVEEWPPEAPADEPVSNDLPIDVLEADGDVWSPIETDPEPRFVQQAKRHARWSTGPMRAVVWSGVVLTTFLLALQWAVHDRDRLAAWQPAFEPVLSAICRPLGCRIEPVRQLDAVVIDSSALVRLIGQLHALDVVLKNNRAWPLAMPSLELSLTDGQNQILARRVLSAQDWPNAPKVLAPGESLPVKLRLSIALSAGQSMAGYRVVLFYP